MWRILIATKIAPGHVTGPQVSASWQHFQITCSHMQQLPLPACMHGPDFMLLAVIGFNLCLVLENLL